MTLCLALALLAREFKQVKDLNLLHMAPNPGPICRNFPFFMILVTTDDEATLANTFTVALVFIYKHNSQ